MAESIVAFDSALAQLLVGMRTEALTELSLVVTALGGVGVTLVVVFALGLYGLVHRRYREVVALLVTVGGAEASVYLIKALTKRERPGIDIAYYLTDTFSFPSAHTAVAVAMYGIIAYFLIRTFSRWRVYVLVGVFTLMTGIGLSRMYLGVHFLSDVVAGAAVGALWLTIGINIAKGAVHRKHAGSDEYFIRTRSK